MLVRISQKRLRYFCDYRNVVIMTIAQNITRKFGGAAHLAAVVGVDVSTVYRWSYPCNRGGTGGIIPAKYHQMILDRSKCIGVDLSPSDFFLPSSELPPNGGQDLVPPE